MKLLIKILILSLSLNVFAGTGGISSLFGFGDKDGKGKNGRVDAGTGGIVGGVDELKDLQHKDWSTIREAVKQDYKLDLQGDIAFVGKIVSVFDVCINNDKVQTISKHPVYKRVRLAGNRDNDRYKDVVIGHKRLSFPLTREVKKQICFGKRDNNCREYTEVENFSQTKKITLRVEKKHSRENIEYKDVFTKPYDVPYCQ